ncbi:hypothetical protein H5410_002973 [Solanum commersonii]|uniref:Uncharacterized protein n=1 Tax=Solanum commersonii TaxID=4109 RepID=A0A9J6B3Q1_SOLCO|nr:hypothetical protein H5410_002973 [Solanum commersonii]
MCSSVKEKVKLAMKWSSRRVADLFRKAVPYRPTTQNARRRRLNSFPTHSARESEWAKAEAMLNVAIRCLRETELIRVVN